MARGNGGRERALARGNLEEAIRKGRRLRRRSSATITDRTVAGQSHPAGSIRLYSTPPIVTLVAETIENEIAAPLLPEKPPAPF